MFLYLESVDYFMKTDEKNRKQKLPFSSLSGTVKGGKKGNAEEIDRIVYGV